MKTLKFIKEDDIWYIDEWYLKFLPKSALMMVLGADTLLDKLTKDGETAKVKVYRRPKEGAIKAKLIEPNNLSNGGNYTVQGPKGYPKKMWLCNVTRVVYLGKMPKEIYIVNASK
jgi:hypothetical protein